jgi:Uma2 family endonuclease
MHMALETRPWTRSDLNRLPDDGNTYEVVDGALLVTPAPSAAHQRIVAWLNAVLTPFVVSNGIGVVHQARSVMVAGGSQVEPDLMVLAFESFQTWESAPVPLLVVEVLSDSTRTRDLGEKRRFYIQTGVAEYWAVDRKRRSLVRFAQAGPAETITTRFAWQPRGAEATLEIDLAAAPFD